MDSPGPTSHPDGDSVRLDRERAAVVTRIEQMNADLQSLFDASRDSNADDEHDPEGQTIAYERAQLTALLTQARAHLVDLDTARERVSGGTYGVCEVCGESIGAGRLEARPTATTCVEHAPRSPRRL